MYGVIGDIKRYNLNVIKNGEIIYTGKTEDLPEELKNVHYNEIKFDSGAFLTVEI